MLAIVFRNVALTILKSLLVMQRNCLGRDHDIVTIVRNREVSLVQRSGKHMHVSMADRLEPSMAVCITEVSLFSEARNGDVLL